MVPKISCIFVNYRSSQLLRASLKSLFLYEKEAFFEVIIVNNDRDEASALELMKSEFPQILVDQANDNGGFATAANRGATLATGDILFFVNPDTRWQEAFLQRLREFFNKENAIGVVGVSLRTSKGNPEAFSAGTFLTVKNSLRRVFWRTRYRPAGLVDWVSGAAFAIRADLFRQLNGFDEQFFLYFEDMDLCLRANRNGSRVYYETAYSLTHFSGKSHTGRRSQKQYYDTSLRRYLHKHWSPTTRTLFIGLQAIYRFFYPYGRS